MAHCPRCRPPGGAWRGRPAMRRLARRKRGPIIQGRGRPMAWAVSPAAPAKARVKAISREAGQAAKRAFREVMDAGRVSRGGRGRRLLPCSRPFRHGVPLPQKSVALALVEVGEEARSQGDGAGGGAATVAQIVKSLVFLADAQPVLVLASGANRVDATKLARAAGVRRIAKANADGVRDITGFAIGGVPPVGHSQPLPVYIDRDLLDFETVYAAAGTPTSVFPIAPALLQRLTRGTVVDLREESERQA